MVNRISLAHLTFVGPHKTPANVEFGPRTTVIHGPSDTGKSFIVDAIDFMLGGSSLREIPQRAGYSTVLLGIRTPTGDQITLTRSADGGNFGLLEGDVRALPTSPPERLLGSKHAAKSDNLSRYILGLFELDGKRLRINLYNKTRELSIRDVARLTVVDETKIQSETPPALSGRPTDETGEVSVSSSSSRRRQRPGASTIKQGTSSGRHGEIRGHRRHYRAAEGQVERRARTVGSPTST
jgi:hypothetical protein